MSKEKENWVDYKEIKARVTMETVLAYYGLLEGLQAKGTSLKGKCPIHAGSNSRQFVVSTEKNVFNCFGDCKAGGNVIDFVARMEKIEIREAALFIKKKFLSAIDKKELVGHIKKGHKLIREEKEVPVMGAEATAETEILPPALVPKENKPLTFRLKSLTLDHPFFAERGIAAETAEYFGLGCCSKGMMAGRVVFPIHDSAGELVAYCGRALTPEQIKEEKYKLPKDFFKSLVVYNLHRQEPETKTLIVVESFISVVKLYQAGFKNVVSFMGSSMSEEQEELLFDFLGTAGRVILLFDPDEAGQVGADDCLLRLSRKLYVKAVDLAPYKQKPHQLDPETLNKILEE